MKFRPLGGYLDIPVNGEIEDTLNLVFDYQFMGKRNGEILDLLIYSCVIDYNENIFKRKSKYLIKRIDAVKCITYHIKNHLKNLGIADMELRRLTRDFEVDKSKTLKYDVYKFDNNL